MIIPYIDNNYFFGFPFLPPNCNKPPTVYSILNSIVNGNKEEEDYTKIKNLAKEGRTTIFDFDYPLTSYITKEKFETMVLNHFLMRRIGFETVTAFKIQLDVKLNEIMPMYNKMFNAIENWDLFISGETTTKIGIDNRTQNSTENGTDNSTQNISQDTTNNTQNLLNNTSNTSNNQISDRRKSDLPQNQLQNVRDGSYVTEYNYDTNTNTSQDTSATTGTSSSAVHTGGTTTTQDTTQKTSQSTDNNNYNETITRTPADKIEILKEFQENINSIYTMIFKDLECLFYQLV